jgi:hypothetical protein
VTVFSRYENLNKNKRNYDPHYYYYLNAIGLTPGGRSKHLHTYSTQNSKDGTHRTIIRGEIYKRKNNKYKEKMRSKLGIAGRDQSLRVIPWHLPYN